MAIPYGRQSLDESDVRAVVEVLRGDWLTQGPAVVEFERAFAESARCRMQLRSPRERRHSTRQRSRQASGLETTSSPARSRSPPARTVLRTWAPPQYSPTSSARVERKRRTVLGALTERTRAIVPVHFTGLPAPVAEIRSAVGRDIVIIEDAAHAAGAHTEDEPIGACRHADMAAFSFHPVKAITTGEAGWSRRRAGHFATALRHSATMG